MRSKNQNLHSSIWKNNLWLLKKIWEYTPGFVVWMFVEGIIWGINHAVSIIYVKKLFDALEQARKFEAIAQVILSYAVFMLSFFAFHYWFADTYNPKMREKLHIAMHSDLFKQAVRIDLGKYDDPEFYNDFIWSMDQSCKLAIDFLEDTGKLINRIVSSFALIGVLLSVDKTMAMLIFLLVVIRIILIFFVNKISLACKKELNPLERKDEYIKRVFKLPDYAKELRITKVVRPLFKEHTNNIEQMKEVNRKYGEKLAVLMALIYGSSLMGESLLIILVLYKVLVMHTLGISGFVVAVNASWKMSWLLGDMAERLMKYHEHGIFVEKIITFLECEPQITDGRKEAEQFEALEIKNLKFGYDENTSKKYAVNNISMRIQKGERIAIVGYNGAGKTTLTKLLMRLYDPTEGEILYNGENIKNYTISSLRRHVAAVFQDYRIFACSLAENVAGGKYQKDKEDLIKISLEKSSFGDRLASLPHGIDTQLTREFDKEGVQLSGGEQQKAAIARAFFKNADIVILDEPSSALDPDAEYALNQAISKYAEEKTVIFISHRLSTTRNADRIYMFEEGKIVESGTHEELIEANGKYAYMFHLQAERYQNCKG